LANGSLDLDSLSGGPSASGPMRIFAGWTQKSLARREHPEALEMMNRAVESARLPEGERPAAEKERDADLRSLPRNVVLVRLLMPAMDKFPAATRRKTAMLRGLIVLLALERYRLDKGAWPAKLEELTPKLLKKVPLDPFDGKPLRYRRV